MEEAQTQTEQKPAPKKFNFFGFSSKDIIGLVMIVIGFLLIMIGVFMIAYNLLSKDTPTQQQPPPPQKKPKKPIKKKQEEVQPIVDIEKKEDQIKQNATDILVKEYNNVKIPQTIIQESDTESEREQETKDDSLLD
jgi:uncharacterized membrane protein